jgi:hypothetical protein
MLININCLVLGLVAVSSNSFKSFVLDEKAAVELGGNILLVAYKAC